MNESQGTSEMHRQSAVTKSKEGPIVQKREKLGRLIGWLVSYGLDRQGACIEVREGRTLISGFPLAAPSGAAISVGELSSPHVAVRATSQHEVFVQDIFSDSGTYVVRLRAGGEQRVEGPTPLEHGDWIRLGKDVHFQLCLIDGPR